MRSLIAAAVLVVTLPGRSTANPPQYFRLATGPLSGVEYTFGAALTSALTTPEGSRPCERGGSCGVPGLIASAITTTGGEENLTLLRNGEAEAAVVSAQLAFSAFQGKGYYSRQPPFSGLRAVAHVYTEALHILVPALSPLNTAADLSGQRLVLGDFPAAKDTVLPAMLRAVGVPDKSYRPVFLPPAKAVDALTAGDVGALVVLSGTPASLINDAAQHTLVRLLPLTLQNRAAAHDIQPFLMTTDIPAGTYPAVPLTPTLGVAALLVVRDSLPETLVYALAVSLWHPATKTIAAGVHVTGHSLERDQAETDVPIPFHLGAVRWYRENTPSPSAPAPATSPAPSLTTLTPPLPSASLPPSSPSPPPALPSIQVPPGINAPTP